MSADYDFLDDLLSTAPLDLIYGHLRTVNNNYRELRDYAFAELNNWYCPVGWFANGNEMVATIQPFKAGGYEVTLKNVDMKSLGNLMANKGRVTGKREKPEKQNHDDVIRSVQRAKKKVRQLIKQKGCDRLLTLTRRENNPDTFKNEDEWLSDFQRFIRLCRAAGIELDYVATLEKHKKGNFHLHAAIVGKVHINTVRKIWLQVVGAGQGNVDISFKQNQTATQRLAGVARYVSKYITKQIDNFDFNRKRYWASKSEPLEKPKKIILSAQDMAGALAELAGVLSLDLDVLAKKVFMYGKKSGERAGAWFNYDESMQLEIPF
jgi:hypothetical protein